MEQKWDKTIGLEKGEIHPLLALGLALIALSSASERAILPLKTATREEKCSKVKASNSFLKRFDIWVKASQAILVVVLDGRRRTILNPKAFWVC